MTIRRICSHAGQPNNTSTTEPVVQTDEDLVLDSCAAIVCVDPSPTGAVVNVTLPDNATPGESVTILVEDGATALVDTGANNTLVNGPVEIIGPSACTMFLTCEGSWVPECCCPTPVGPTGPTGVGSIVFDATGGDLTIAGVFAASGTLMPTSPTTFKSADTGSGSANILGPFDISTTGTDTVTSGSLAAGNAKGTSTDAFTMTSSVNPANSISGTFNDNFTQTGISGPVATLTATSSGVVTGGTGRFTGATGTITLFTVAQINLATLTATTQTFFTMSLSKL